MYHHGLGAAWLVLVSSQSRLSGHICSGVGHSPWLSLLMIAPLANIIFVYYLAFSEWPFERRGAISSGGTV
jgi:hypothetical protein